MSSIVGTAPGPFQPVCGQTPASVTHRAQLNFWTRWIKDLTGLEPTSSRSGLESELKEASGTTEHNSCILGEKNEGQRGSAWLKATWLTSDVGSW